MPKTRCSLRKLRSHITLFFTPQTKEKPPKKKQQTQTENLLTAIALTIILIFILNMLEPILIIRRTQHSYTNYSGMLFAIITITFIIATIVHLNKKKLKPLTTYINKKIRKQNKCEKPNEEHQKNCTQ